MLRLFIIGIFLILYFLFGLILLGIYWIIGKFNKPLSDRLALSTVQWAFRVILFLAGAKMHISGRENIPDDTPVVYVSNHQSMFDILAGYTNVKGLCGFIAKIEIEKVPFLVTWMRRLYCLFLDRENIRAGLATILKATDQLKAGISAWICPEGTRNQTPDEVLTAEFKEGSLKMAERAKVPVVPVAISGTYNVWERQFPWIKSAPVYITFGKPFYISDLEAEDKKAPGAYSRKIIEGMLLEIKAEQKATGK